MNDVHDLNLVLDAKIPLLVIEAQDEKRVLEMLTRVSIKRSVPLYQWTVTEGLDRMGFGADADMDASHEPENLLRHIKSALSPAVYVLCDFHPYMKDEPKLVRHIKDIALNHGQVGHVLVFVSHAFAVPPELSRLSARFEMSMPTEKQLMTLVRDEAQRWSKEKKGLKVRTDNATLQHFVKNLSGVSVHDAKRLIRGAIVDDGAITASDVSTVNEAKFKLMDMDGVLSFEYDTTQFTQVGGLSNLKAWLGQRKEAFVAEETSLDQPKGMLLLGVQGGGKSLAAKATAAMLQLPLLRLDFGTLYNKFFGETERNLRDALKQAEVMSPCVLWIDEIEKGIASGDNDGGVSKRILGTLLTWMAERESSVFMVATSNDISQLPPELLRKGRFDEIFFVDLPGDDVREDIFRIHLEKRNEQSESFDLIVLAGASDGFSGSEIEQAIVSALYTAAAKAKDLDTELILEEINNTSPLSIVMAEQIAELRAWAEDRTVSAN